MRNLKTKKEKIMKNSRILSVLGILLAAGSLAMSARAQTTFMPLSSTRRQRFRHHQSDERHLTQISDLGSTLYNDIAYAPDGTCMAWPTMARPW